MVRMVGIVNILLGMLVMVGMVKLAGMAKMVGIVGMVSNDRYGRLQKGYEGTRLNVVVRDTRYEETRQNANHTGFHGTRQKFMVPDKSNGTRQDMMVPDRI